MTPNATKDQSGDAESTFGGNKSAQRVVRYYQVHVLGTEEEELLTELEDGEVKFYIKELLDWVCQTPIPAYFDENLQPTNTNNNHFLTWITVKSYVGKYIMYLRQKFPNVSDWKGLEWNAKSADKLEWWSNC